MTSETSEHLRYIFFLNDFGSAQKTVALDFSDNWRYCFTKVSPIRAWGGKKGYEKGPTHDTFCMNAFIRADE